MGYKIVGNEYTSPDFDADLFAREMIAKCEALIFPWSEIRMDDDGYVYAYSMGANLETHSGNWSRKNSMGFAKFLGQLDGDEFEWSEFGIIRKTEIDSMAILKYTQAGQDFNIVGADDYTGNLLGDNLSRLVFELVDMANKKLPNWTEIRMDEEFGVAAYTEAPRTEYGCWVCGTNEFAPLDYFESNRGLNWQDFGIIRKTEADSMDYKIVGIDGYKPHPSHMESIAAGLVADATARCDDWKEIRIDANGSVFVYNFSPTKRECTWDWRGGGGCFRITDLSTELEVGLNWQTFGIIRTEDAEEDVKEETAKLSEYELFEWRAQNVRYQAGPTVWQNARVEQPERTIADITNERIALLWTAIDELREWFDELETKTPDTVNTEGVETDAPELIKLPDILWKAHIKQPHTTLTPELIAALSDWPDSALETIAQAIADGRIVLQ